MYYYLVSALKRRLVLELKDSFSRHPVYDKIVPYIQSKNSFKERPQFGIVVKGSSANKVQLSADNFIGQVQSHVMLSYLTKPSYMLEWVREDISALRANSNQMPTAPGVYYIECLQAPTNVSEPGSFIIDPLLTVTDEPLIRFESGIEKHTQLQNPPATGTLRLWENHNFMLAEGKDYTVNYTTGEVTLSSRFYPNSVLTADYRYPSPSIGPVPFFWNKADFTTLPGVVLAFGKRAATGDKIAVTVYQDHVDTANAFGGRIDLSFDLDVISQDPIQMEEIADFAFMTIWNEKRPALSFEGIEVVDISIGGEAEEQYDETADLFYYNANMSVQMQTDWEAHSPLPLTISKASMTSASAQASVDFDRGTDAKSNLVQVMSKLLFAASPIIVGRNNSFEKIG